MKQPNSNNINYLYINWSIKHIWILTNIGEPFWLQRRSRFVPRGAVFTVHLCRPVGQVDLSDLIIKIVKPLDWLACPNFWTVTSSMFLFVIPVSKAICKTNSWAKQLSIETTWSESVLAWNDLGRNDSGAKRLVFVCCLYHLRDEIFLAFDCSTDTGK